MYGAIRHLKERRCMCLIIYIYIYNIDVDYFVFDIKRALVQQLDFFFIFKMLNLGIRMLEEVKSYIYI